MQRVKHGNSKPDHAVVGGAKKMTAVAGETDGGDPLHVGSLESPQTLASH